MQKKIVLEETEPGAKTDIIYPCHLVDSPMENEEPDNTPNDSGILARYAKPLGALLVTGLILYFLFGIPAYLLFREM